MKNTVSINKNRIFKSLYRRGNNIVTQYFVVYYRKNRLKINRLGLTATKKIGKAPERNRCRRVIKEAYRLLEPELPVGYDIVIAARKKAGLSKTQDIMSALRDVKF
ncbi:MAG: ribonuclease P protein component [Oscillospiraceae bacterium]|nr:ribonuclease P protein component [Oscillospiraceae bacterium]